MGRRRSARTERMKCCIFGLRWIGRMVGGGRRARYAGRMEVWGLRGKAKSVNV